MPTVKHNILQWARENTKLTIEEAAPKLSLTDTKKKSATEKLISFESGEMDPSRSLLLRMSKQYHLPLLTFYLNKPPTIGERGEDFRTLPDHLEEIENVNVDILIRDIKARQSTVRETLIDADEENRLEFVGKYTSENGVLPIVQTIRKVLNFNIDDYRNKQNHKEAFRFLRQKVEKAGVFVLLKGNIGSYHSNIALTAFRGFALSDDIAPFIVINDLDAESAWSFTLIHEMTHLILGQTGISGAYSGKQVEKFCNDVASEFLLSKSEFDLFQISNLTFEDLQLEISNYAFSQKLSSSQIAYRLYKREDIDKSLWKRLGKYYHDKWLENRQTIQNKNKQKEGGPSYYMVKNYKLGGLVELVQRLMYSGALTTTKAGMLLDMKPLKVHRLFQTKQLV